MNKALETELENIISDYLVEQNFTLFKLSFKNTKQDLLIELIIDQPKGGITLDECADVNRYLVNFLDEQKMIDEEYSISVSSPGLDWPLKTTKDFFRVLGREARVHLSEKVENKLEYSGKIEDVSDESIMLSTKTGSVTISLGKITKAVQVFDTERKV